MNDAHHFTGFTVFTSRVTRNCFTSYQVEDVKNVAIVGALKEYRTCAIVVMSVSPSKCLHSNLLHRLVFEYFQTGFMCGCAKCR